MFKRKKLLSADVIRNQVFYLLTHCFGNVDIQVKSKGQNICSFSKDHINYIHVFIVENQFGNMSDLNRISDFSNNMFSSDKVILITLIKKEKVERLIDKSIMKNVHIIYLGEYDNIDNYSDGFEDLYSKIDKIF
jgi:hypothetical protein